MSQKTTKVSKLKKVKIEPMTIGEFRAKLEGIEMFQDENWVPTKEQWDLIREMINNVLEPTVSNNFETYQNTHQSNQDQVQRTQWGQQKQPPSMLARMNPNMDSLPQANYPMEPTGGTIQSSKYVVKTDESGNIKSAFE